MKESETDCQLLTLEEEPKLTLYKRRWVILAIVAMLNLTNAMLWISFAPIANIADSFYCGSEENKCDAANLLSLIFMVCSIPVGFIAMFCVDKFGLKPSVLSMSWLNAVGATIRIFASSPALLVSARFPVVMLGQFIAAIAQPWLMYMPTKLASLWFPEDQRAIANTLGSMANPLGIMLAMLLSPMIVKDTPDLWIMCIAYAVPCIMVAFIASVAMSSSLPPSPPSISAGEDSPNFKLGLKSALKNRQFVVLMICLGGGVGLFNAIFTCIQQFLCPKGYSNDFSGLCGALLIAGGLVGSALAGVIVDKTKAFQEVLKFSFCMAAFVVCFLPIALSYVNQPYPVTVLITLFGFFGLAVYPIGLELGVECTYPVAEATSAGLIIISGQIQGVIFVVLLAVVCVKDLLPSSSDWLVETCSVESVGSPVEARDMSSKQ